MDSRNILLADDIKDIDGLKVYIIDGKICVICGEEIENIYGEYDSFYNIEYSGIYMGVKTSEIDLFAKSKYLDSCGSSDKELVDYIVNNYKSVIDVINTGEKLEYNEDIDGEIIQTYHIAIDSLVEWECKGKNYTVVSFEGLGEIEVKGIYNMTDDIWVSLQWK